MPLASAEAAPPLEPPGVRSRAQGLNVRPRSALSVCQRRLKAGVFVRPTMTAPARFQLATGGLSLVAITSLKATTPLAVAWPVWSMFSLIVTGTPWSSPTASPRLTAASAASAAASAGSASTTVTALIAGLTASRRSSTDCTASRLEIFRIRMAAASSTASQRHSSRSIGMPPHGWCPLPDARGSSRMIPPGALTRPSGLWLPLSLSAGGWTA